MSIYLDYNATTPVDPDVREAICQSLVTNWGNPSSSYSFGKDAKNIIKASREKVAKMISCNDEEIIFTSGGTESNNMVIHSAIKDFKINFHPDNYNPQLNNSYDSIPHIITTNIEHDSVRLPLNNISSNNFVSITVVPVSKLTGMIEVNDILSAVRPTTCLITIMLANNETGIIQPVKSLSTLIKKLEHDTKHRKILIHTDAAQAIGKIDVNVQELGVDFLTIVGHKFYGPRIGALYIRQGIKFFPMFFGGGQERNFRPGTENTCMIAGLGKAAELIILHLNTYENKMLKARTHLENLLKSEFGNNVVFNVNTNVERLPNTVSVAFNYDFTGQDLLKEAKDICASTGAACHSGNEPSAILLASGISKSLASRTLRLSVGRETTMEDITKAVQSLKKAISKLCKTHE